MTHKQGLFKHIFTNKEDIILRDYLALERTKLANERTLLSYTRTSLYMVLGGIAFLQLQDFSQLRWIGYVAIFLSVIFGIFGILRYLQIRIRIGLYYNQKKNEPTVSED
ncbi:MAG: DUF202 domain-containing protein [Bacteroidales bacterium]|mgnify:CR=1 FL=1|jgi:putative membrane protein|nr:DUF202 domain-containing protein [Bacteroidales bacterium]MDD4383787.1 DUF202 domain-containing protein [Bacteroidales bacterium]MDY0198340.1 DUF202 domain-containing protein [Tenuifilaceae bacterium]